MEYGESAGLKQKYDGYSHITLWILSSVHTKCWQEKEALIKDLINANLVLRI